MDTTTTPSGLDRGDQLRAAAETISEAVIVIDPTGVVVFANAAVETLLGRSRAQLIGRRYDELGWIATDAHLPGLLSEALLFTRVLRTGEPVRNAKLSFARAEGGHVHVEIDATPLRDERGAILGAVVSLRELDACALREARYAVFESTLRAFMDASPDPIGIHRDGRFVYVNPATASLLGYERPEDLIGRSPLEFVHPDDQAIVRERMRLGAEERRPMPAREERFISRTGRVLTAVVTSLPFFYEGAPSVLALAHDVTAQHAAEMERERLLHEIDTQRQLFRTLFDNAPIGLALLYEDEHDFVFELVNPAFQAIVPGVKLEHQPLTSVAPEMASLVPILKRVMESGVPEHVHEIPLRIRRKNEGPLVNAYFTVAVARARSPQDGHMALIGMVIETTEEVLARQEASHLAEAANQRAAELRAVLDTMSEAVFVCNAAAGLTLANRAAMRALGVEQLDALRTVLEERPALSRVRRLDGTPLPREEWPPVRALSGTEVTDVDVLFLDPTRKSQRQMRLNAAPIRNHAGAVVGAVAVARDVTEQAEFEWLKDEFVRVAAHELKTPVAVMKGYAQALLRAKIELPEEYREILRAIDRGATRIDRTVQDLLDISQLHLGHLQLVREKLDLAALVARVVERAAAMSVRHRVSLVHAETATVLGDPERLTRVVNALIDNALRYSPEGGEVDVAIAVRNGEAVLSVSDRGVGIPRDKQPWIFQRFFRAHAGTASDYGGMGVSLYLSNEVIARLGGRMWFESDENRGSTFYVALPLWRSNGEG